MVKRLIFLDTEEIKKLKDFNRKDIILLDYPPKEFSGLSLEKIRKFDIEEFYPKKLLKGLDKKSDALLERLYKKVEGKVNYKGIDLFSVVKNKFYTYYFIHFVRYVDMLDYIIKKRKPEKIIVGYHKSNKKSDNFIENPELSVDIIKEICRVKKIPLKIKTFRKREKNQKESHILLGKIQNLNFKLKSSNNKKNILFIGGKNAYLPILKALKGKARTIRCGINPGLSLFNKDQDDYFTFGNKPKRINLEKQRRKILSEIEKVTYKRLSLKNIFSPNINYLLNDYFKRMMRWIDTAYKLEPKINTLVTTNDTITFEQILIKIFRKKKKDCYVIQHGYTTIPEHFFPLVKGKMLANKMFVWGKSSKDWMVKEGLKKDKLIITGSPKFDEDSNDNGRDIKKTFNIPKNKKIVCLIAEANLLQKDPQLFLLNNEEKEFYKIIFKEIKKEKDLFLIVKPHPSHRRENVLKEIFKEEKMKNGMVISKNFPIRTLLKQSDLIMTLGSTVTLEAMFFKKPIIILDLFKKRHLVPFIKNKMCIGIRNRKKLRDITLYGIKNKDKVVKKYEKRFKDYSLNDKRASERISKVLLK